MAKSKIGLFHAIRDIGVASVNRGQLLLFGVILIMLISVCKMSGDQINDHFERILNFIERRYLLGYILWVATGTAYIVHARILIRKCYSEQTRIADERNKAQTQAGIKPGTTKKK
jgi:hypothetical protein